MHPVEVPFLAFLLLAALAAWALVNDVALPAVRAVLRRRSERVMTQLATRLKIRIEPFRQTRRRILVDRLLYDFEVLEAAGAMAEAEGLPKEAVSRRVKEYAREIVPAFNAYVYFRVGTALARRTARALYRVRLGYSDEEALARIPPRSTVVFVMNHRSNMDYILVSFLAAEKTALSYAVGEWARIWPIEQLIRASGAYFIRRGSRDALYRKVLERYIQMAVGAGVTQAVFPEGGLSRDGRMRPPKLGLLDYMLRAYEPGSARADGAAAAPAERDIVFVPVGVNYDRVLEDRTLLLDLDPAAPRKKGLAALAKTASFVADNLRLMLKSEWRRFGYAVVSFGTPLSLRAYLDERGLDLARLAREERQARVEELGRTLMAAIARVVPAVPVAMVASVLVRDPSRRLTLLELKSEVLALRRELEARGVFVYLPRSDEDYAVTVGLRMLTLRRIVEEPEPGAFRPRAEELRLLTYYANSLEPAPPRGAPEWRADRTPAAAQPSQPTR